MTEIIVRSPRTNPESKRFTGYTFYNDTVFNHFLAEGVIQPQTHPRIADVCAGDGSVARLLADAGWDKSRITCIDRFRPGSPLVDGVNWQFWDIENLRIALLVNELIPDQIAIFENQFDAVFMMFARGIGSQIAEPVLAFLAKSGAVAYYSGSNTSFNCSGNWFSPFGAYWFIRR